MKKAPLLDVSATRDVNRLTLFVVNRDARDHQEARLEIEWKGSLRFPPCSVTAIVLGA